MSKQLTQLGPHYAVREPLLGDGAAIVVARCYPHDTKAVLQPKEMDRLVAWWAEHRPADDVPEEEPE